MDLMEDENDEDLTYLTFDYIKNYRIVIGWGVSTAPIM